MKHRTWPAVIALFFLLGIHDGYIALWKDGADKPVEVFPIQAKLLPEADQKMLRQGIRIESAEHLARLMEDYLS